MKLVVGLGNPGNEYLNTRHNIGFMFLDRYVKSIGLDFNKKKFNGIYCTEKINDENVIFLKPQSFINLSGEVVDKFVNYFNISIDNILIISDDLDLEIGKYKLKASGSSGGHNGLKNIELFLNTQSYKRLKIGISNNKLIDTKDYVLGKIDSDSKKEYDALETVVINIINDFFKLDFDALMCKYNRK